MCLSTCSARASLCAHICTCVRRAHTRHTRSTTPVPPYTEPPGAAGPDPENKSTRCRCAACCPLPKLPLPIRTYGGLTHLKIFTRPPANRDLWRPAGGKLVDEYSSAPQAVRTAGGNWHRRPGGEFSPNGAAAYVRACVAFVGRRRAT